MKPDMLIFSGNANPALSQKICNHLDLPLSDALVTTFKDGEIQVEIRANVRGKDVFIVQPTCAPSAHNIMEALIMVDACKRASSKRITVVMPYFGYARQERKSAPRTPITAKLVADLFTQAGADRILVMELHTAAIQGFFNIPVDHLFSKPIFGPYFEKHRDLLVVSPDAGGVERARAMAKYFNCGLAIVDKRRDKPNESSVMNIIGDVRGKNCLIVDDIVDTGTSLCKAAEALMDQGAIAVSAAISHAVLSGDAAQKIADSCITELVVSDSIPLSEHAKKVSKIKCLTISELLGKAIRRIHHDDSISSLFV